MNLFAGVIISLLTGFAMGVYAGVVFTLADDYPRPDDGYYHDRR